MFLRKGVDLLWGRRGDAPRLVYIPQRARRAPPQNKLPDPGRNDIDRESPLT